jgi:hypothetical protein
MSKFYSHIFKLQVILCFVLALSLNIFAQTGSLNDDLKGSFKKFDLVKIEKGSALQRSGDRVSLRLAAAEKQFEIDLVPNDLRAARYRAEVTAGADRRPLEMSGPVTTFKNEADGSGDAPARLTIDGDLIEGFFTDGGARYFIEPAGRHSAFASKDDFVLFQEGDFINPEGFTCFSEIEEKIDSGKDYVFGGGPAQNLTAYRVIELATEADFEFVSSRGGAQAANNEILSILNMVEGVYESELGLTINVVYQHAWTTDDPFDTNNPGTSPTCLSSLGKVLCNFKDYWNANFPPAQVPRDAAHLWSGKAAIQNQGFAFIREMCDPVLSYGMSGASPWQQARVLIAAHEIGHNLGAEHAEAAQNCGNTLMNAQLSTATPLTFCTLSRTQIANYLATGGGCLTPESAARATFDFDGDGRSDIGVFRPSNGVWYIDKSTGGVSSVAFGLAGDKPVAADYNGDGKSDQAVYRNGVWYVLKSANNSFYAAEFGLATDLPAPADFDGDGRADLAVFRPSDGSWHRLNSSNGAYLSVQFGLAGDVPVPADYDGDGKADINVFRPSNGTWYRLNSNGGTFFAAQFGMAGDRAVAGDFDGDGKNDLAVFRPSTGVWYVLRSSNGSFYAVGFGLAEDIPAPADFDGDGKTDINVFRPSNSVWYRMNSSNGAYVAQQFGLGSDLPVHSYDVR